MAETVQVTIDGKRKAMTRREVLDRLVRHQAQIKGGRWLGIWEERQARDRALAELLAAFEAEERVLAQLRLDQPHVVMRQQRHAQERAQGKMLDQIERVAPGLLDCLSQLHDAGAVEQQDGRLVKADWLCKASATNDPKAGSR